MYQAEVLGKLPVMQHFLFGSILPWDGPAPPSTDETDDAHRGHAHTLPPGQMGWGDCCGIPVPSAFAAAQAEAKGDRQKALKLEGPGIRPVPFD